MTNLAKYWERKFQLQCRENDKQTETILRLRAELADARAGKNVKTEDELFQLWQGARWTVFIAEDGYPSIAMVSDDERVLEFARTLGVEIKDEKTET